jgi:predicted MFS family arabinose efflux permease
MSMPAAPPAVAARPWPNLALFLVAMSLLSAAGGMFETTFNNFVSDVYHMQAMARGALEFPRELPGFLTALLIAALALLAETRVAAVAAFATGLGMLGLAWAGGSWTTMMVALTVWSVGTHLIMPVRSSIGMDLASGGSRGRMLGRISGVSVAASIVGCGLVWLLMRGAGGDYRTVFTIAAGGALLGSVVLLCMRLPGAHVARPRFVWNNRYWLYYVLSFLFGARKQIFITFGPWVLIKVFHQPAVIFAQLWIVAGVLGMAFQPLLGRAIDRFGERRVLTADALVIVCVCLGYGYAHRIGHAGAALGLLYACFVLDQLFFGTGMARDIYLSKIAARKEDVAPTLSLGVSINHAVSMSVPALGGWLWMRHGHDKVFLAAAAVALVMLFFACRVPDLRSAPGRAPCRPSGFRAQ